MLAHFEHSQSIQSPHASLDLGRHTAVTGTAWFGIRTAARSEPRAFDELCRQGFEAFLPSRPVKRRWSDRIRTVDAPIFPGYLFCRFPLSERLRVLNAPGVAQIIGAGRTPIPISETEIQSVKTLVSSKIALMPWPYLRSGQRVWMERGPLAGVEGVVVQAEDGKPRVVVAITLLQRAVAAQIERDWISRVEAAGNPLRG